MFHCVMKAQIVTESQAAGQLKLEVKPPETHNKPISAGLLLLFSPSHLSLGGPGA